MLVGGVLLVAASLGAGYWWGRHAHEVPVRTGATGERKVLYWYDPMVPGQHFDKPGKSPYMDMALVPRYADESTVAGAEKTGATISPRVQQNLGIRTVVVARGTLGLELHATGTVVWDARRAQVLSVPVDAVVQRLYVKTPYAAVHAGEPLASVLAPQWRSAISEAHALGQAQSAEAKALREAARARLTVLGVPAGTAAGPGGGLVLRAPASGVVSEIAVREGAAVSAGTVLFRIDDPGHLWVIASIPQAVAGAVRPGTPATVQFAGFPGRQFAGRVDTLLPELDPGNRTQPARIALANPEGLLAPGMLADVTLSPAGASEQLLVPGDAVILDGTTPRVIVQDDNGRFRPVAVAVGRSSGGRTEVLSGLAAGTRIVVSGQFLIDSEASLSGALDRLNAGQPTPEPAP
jgi:Cu(I)/Ag(I) efflux system membrane fusion protein